jgi:hypothetical protein
MVFFPIFSTGSPPRGRLHHRFAFRAGTIRGAVLATGKHWSWKAPFYKGWFHGPHPQAHGFTWFTYSSSKLRSTAEFQSHFFYLGLHFLEKK